MSEAQRGPARPGPANARVDGSSKLQAIERGVGERLRELAESGGLSGLPGEGRPFERDDDASGDRWAAFRVLRNNSVLPDWAQLRKEIDAERERIARHARAHLDWSAARQERLIELSAERIVEASRATRERDALVRSELTAAVGALNALVARYNARVPAASLQLVPFSVDRLFAEAERNSDGEGAAAG